jgi:predicted double-glycine peptidase
MNLRACKQSTNYSCGPAALRTIFNYYKVKVSEKELLLLGDIGEEGTDFKTMKKLSNEFGFTFHSRENGNLEIIKKYINKDIPVLVCYQMGQNNGNNGHYSVVYNIDDSFIHLADPSNWIEGDRKKYSENRKMLIDTFLEHWWEEDIKVIKRWYAIIKPRKVHENKKIIS